MISTKQSFQSNRLWQFLLGCFNIILFFPSLVLADHFLFTDLGENRIPIALSNNGAILMEDRTDPDGEYTRYIWANGVEIRTPEGATIHGLNELNNQTPALALVGSMRPIPSGRPQAYQWQLIGAGLNPMQTAAWDKINLPIPNGTLLSQAISINPQGTVLGQREVIVGNPELFYIDLNSQGRRNFNPPIRDYPLSEARAINASGDITGTVTDANGIQYSYVYRQDKGAGYIIPNTLSSDNNMASEALDLSDRDRDIWVVGRAQIREDRWQAYVAVGESMRKIDTDTLDGDNSVARGINNAGDVVGQAQNSEGEDRAFFYNIYSNTFVDLTSHQGTLIKISAWSGIITDATAINHRGMIIGTAMLRDVQYGYLLTPTDKDPSFQLKEQAVKCPLTTPNCPLDISARAIAINGRWMALGQYDANKVTLLHQGNDNAWFYHSTLQPNDIAVDDQFGFSVALQEKRLVVGANLDDSAGTLEDTDVGAVYVYHYNDTRDQWDFDTKIVPSQTMLELKFGNAVSVYGEHILVNTAQIDPPAFYYVLSVIAGWEEKTRIQRPGLLDIDPFAQLGRLGQSFAILGAEPRNASVSAPSAFPATYSKIAVYTANNTGFWVNDLITRGGIREIELHNNTIATGPNGFYTSGSVTIFHHQNGQWHYQSYIGSPFSYEGDSYFGGEFALYADNLVVTSTTRFQSSYFLNFFGRIQEYWYFRAQQLLNRKPAVMALNRETLAVSPGDRTTPIRIFSLTPPQGVDLSLTVDNPLENIISKAGDLVTYQATITNQNLEREAWNAQLQIDLNNDRFMTNNSDPRCLWQMDIARMNCDLGSIPAQASIPLAITLQHQSPTIHFTAKQQGTDPQPSNDTVSIDTQFSDVDIALTMTANRAEVTPNGIVDFTLNVQSDEAESIVTLLTLSAPISVAYETDNCQPPQSLCNKVGELTDFNYIVTVPPNQSTTFTVSLRFPTAGNYNITANAPWFAPVTNPTNHSRTDTLSIQVGSTVPEIRIINRKKRYTLKDNQAMPPFTLTVHNWPLENTNTGKHIDWSLSQASTLVKEGHIITTSVSLGPLEPGDYTFQVALIDTNHGSTDYQDQIPFTVQRPPPTVKILQPADNSTILLSADIGFNLQLVVDNWSMKTNGKHYRVIWDGEEVGRATALTLNLTDILSPANLAEGPHQLMVELIDETGTVKASSNTITVTIQQARDVTVHWREVPLRIALGQVLNASLSVVNNNPDQDAIDTNLILTIPTLLTVTEALPDNCSPLPDIGIHCTLAKLVAKEQRDMTFKLTTTKQGSVTLIATVQQPSDPTPDNNTDKTTVQIFQPNLTILTPVASPVTLFGPETLTLTFKIDHWLDQPEQGVQGRINDGESQVLTTNPDKTGQWTLPGLTLGTHNIELQLTDTDQQPTGINQTLTVEVVPSSGCMTTEPNCAPFIQWREPIAKVYVRLDDQPLDLNPQLNITNWFDQAGKTRYRWWLNGNERDTLTNTTTPIILNNLANGSYQLKATLLYDDNTETAVSHQVEFAIMQPFIVIHQPEDLTTYYLHTLPDTTTPASSIQLLYEIRDWAQGLAGKVFHQVWVNGEKIPMNDETLLQQVISPLDLTEYMQVGKSNTLEVKLVDSNEAPIGVQSQINVTIEEGKILPAQVIQVKEGTGALGGWLLLGMGLLGWRRLWVFKITFLLFMRKYLQK